MARRRRDDRDLDATVVIDKPAGMTSHDVVADLRRTLGIRRIGHSGTLDPDATGVMLLGVGRGTRLLRFTDVFAKRYVATVVLGVETSTLDAAGEVTATHDMSGVRPGDIEAAASGFVGDIEQVPPMVSAVKVGGRRLHELAREGQEVARESRLVTVHDLEVRVGEDPTTFGLDVTCSSGTYVRSLAADIGAALGGGAHLTDLRRVGIGPFGEEDASTLDEPVLRPVADLVAHLDGVEVDDELARRVSHGQLLGAEHFAGCGPEPVAVVGPDGALLAVYEGDDTSRPDGSRKPAVVLTG